MRSYYPAPGTGTSSGSPNAHANTTLFFDNLRGKQFWGPFQSRSPRATVTSPTLAYAPRQALLGGLRSRFGIVRPKTLNIITSTLHSPSNSNVSPSKSVSALRNFFRRRKVTFSPPLLQRSRSGDRARSPTGFSGGAGSPSHSGSRTPSPILGGRILMRPGSASAATGGSTGMDWKQNISSDHTDIAYREAVSRLRSILSPRERPSSAQAQSNSQSAKENLGSGSDSSPPTKLRKDRLRRFFSPPRTTDALNNMTSAYNRRPGGLGGGGRGHPSTVDQDDLFDFIEKQSAYISQLEKEAQSSRTDLGTVLAHVRQIIGENETLHERQKQDLFSSMIRQLDDKTGGDLHSRATPQSQLIRDSKVAEMDVQLNQTKRALRAAQEEILELRRSGGGGGVSKSDGGGTTATTEAYATKIESLTREKDDLLSTLSRLKEQIGELRDRESEATRKVKSSLEVVEQMQLEKAASDAETRRAKEELDRHQQRIRELIQDHSRRLYEEKLQVESKYRQELDLLHNEMSAETETAARARVDLERQKRVETELRRELSQRVSAVEELRQELGLKISHLQSELQLALSQKGHVEQELCLVRLGAEKAERDAKHEVGRLAAEIQALRKRTEEADGELSRAQEVATKLNVSMLQMQHENAKARIRLEERGIAVPVTAGTGVGGGDFGVNSTSGDIVLMSSMIQAMEDKHSRDMGELEQLVQVQNGLLDKLRAECKLLTDKLESTSVQYNKEKTALSAEKERLSQQLRAASGRHSDLHRTLDVYKSSQAQMTERLHSLEEDEHSRSDRIFQLLSKQSGLLKENQSLQNEVSLLKTKIKAHAQSLRWAGGDENDDDRTRTKTSHPAAASRSRNRGIN